MPMYEDYIEEHGIFQDHKLGLSEGKDCVIKAHFNKEIKIGRLRQLTSSHNGSMSRASSIEILLPSRWVRS